MQMTGGHMQIAHPHRGRGRADAVRLATASNQLRANRTPPGTRAPRAAHARTLESAGVPHERAVEAYRPAGIERAQPRTRRWCAGRLLTLLQQRLHRRPAGRGLVKQRMKRMIAQGLLGASRAATTPRSPARLLTSCGATPRRPSCASPGSARIPAVARLLRPDAARGRGFVVADEMQFTTNGWAHRNRVRGPDGPHCSRCRRARRRGRGSLTCRSTPPCRGRRATSRRCATSTRAARSRPTCCAGSRPCSTPARRTRRRDPSGAALSRRASRR